jgi:hypothetical protein
MPEKLDVATGAGPGEVVEAPTPRVTARPLAAFEPPPPVTALSAARAAAAVQEAVDGLLAGRDRLWALEAGAGKRTRLDLPEDTYIVGVDRDAEALALNGRLDERVRVDLDQYAPTAVGFDLITCWYVLEHVHDPGTVLDRLADWTCAGGLVVLAVPNLRSPKSLITKLTPHRFHVWFRRRVLGYPNAGKPGYGPYPTTLRRPIAPRRLLRRFARHGYTPAFQVYFEDAKQLRLRQRIGLTGDRWQWAQAAVRILSLGWLDAARSEYAVVFRRDAPIGPRAPVPPSQSR